MTNLLECFEGVSNRVDEGELVDVLLLDFQAAFKHVPCVRWVKEVGACGIRASEGRAGNSEGEEQRWQECKQVGPCVYIQGRLEGKHGRHHRGTMVDRRGEVRWLTRRWRRLEARSRLGLGWIGLCSITPRLWKGA